MMIQRKITILAPDFKPMLGGVAEYSFQLAEKLNEQGILDRVITPNIQSESFDFNVAAPKDFPWLELFKGQGLIKRKIYSFFYLCQLRWIEIHQLWYWIRHREQVFVIVNWIASPLSKRWIFILDKLQIQHAIILYGKDIIIANNNENSWFEHICSKSTLIILISHATTALFHRLQPNIEVPKYLLYPSIDINYFQKFTLSSLEDLEKKFDCNLTGKIIFSSVCRLVKRKGIDLAIKAVEPLLRENKDLIYIIMGVGEEYQSIQDLISSLNLNDRVKLVGDREDDDKFSLLQASSIFIMPNLDLGGNDFEGFGISFLEASFFKNVVIGGRNGGAVEAIKDEYSGFLVDVDSENAVGSIRSVVASLLNNPEKISQMSEFGHKYAIENFQATVTVNAFSEYMQENFLSK
jgi:phosphatidyl-myo-inositol dimannoside synthase